MTKKLLSIILCLGLIFSVVPAEVIAAGTVLYDIQGRGVLVARVALKNNKLALETEWSESLNGYSGNKFVFKPDPAKVPDGKVFDKFSYNFGKSDISEESLNIQTVNIEGEDLQCFTMPDCRVVITAVYSKVLKSGNVTVTAPFSGNKPDTTADAYSSEGELEVSQIKWVENDTNENFTTFTGKNKYTVKVYLTTPDGFILGNETQITINGKAATLNEDGSYSYDFQTGETYKITASGCKVAAIDGNNNIVTEWSEILNVPSGTAVIIQDNYTVPDGKVFSHYITKSETKTDSNLSSKMVGGNHYNYFVSTEEDLTVEPVFDEIISEIRFTVVEPEGGCIPSKSVTVPADAKYFPSKDYGVSWAELDGGQVNDQWNETMPFVAGKQYICEIYYDCEEGYTDSAGDTKIYINDNEINYEDLASYTGAIFTAGNLKNALAPKITPPASTAVNGMYGRDVTLSVDAVSQDGGTLTYQWYKNSKNSTDGGTKIAGETDKDYLFSPDRVGTSYYYCVVTNTNDNAEINKAAKETSPVIKVETAKLTVDDFSLVGKNIQAEDEKTPNGNDGKITYIGMGKVLMEYADNPEFENSKDVVTLHLENLKPGIYYFRYKPGENVGECNYDTIVIYPYAPQDKAKPALFTVNGRVTTGEKFDESIAVSILNNKSYGSCYYTLDGTEPDTNSDKYVGNPILIDKTCELKAVCVYNEDFGNKVSDVSTASFIKKENVKISFNANGGSGTMNDAFCEAGTEYTLPDCSFSAPNYKRFIGWKVNGAGDILEPSSKIQVTGAVELVAQWDDKLPLVIEGVSVSSKEYDGKVIEPIVNPVFKTTEGQLLYDVSHISYFTLKGKTSIQDNIAAPSDAGDYTFHFIAFNADRTDSLSIDVSITPKALSWDTSDIYASKREDETDLTVKGTLNVKGLLGDDTYTAPAAPFTIEGADEITEAGTYKERQLLNADGLGSVSKNYKLPSSLPTIDVAVTKVEKKPEFTDEETDKIYRPVVENGISSVSDDIVRNNSNLDTPAKIEEAMRVILTDTGIRRENTVVYDLMLLVKEGSSTWRNVTEEDFEGGKTIEVLLPYPEGTNASGFNFKVSHMFEMGDRAGTFEHPGVTKKTNGISFRLAGLSPVSVGWSAVPSSSSSGKNNSYLREERDFWDDVADKIKSSEKGDIVKADAGSYTKMPWTVMEELRHAKDVTLKIEWDGKDIVIPSSAALNDPDKVYYNFKYLAQLDFASPSGVVVNPATGA